MVNQVKSFINHLPSGERSHFAMENGPVEIVDFPIKNGGSFHGKMLVHQRVNHLSPWIFYHLKRGSVRLRGSDLFCLAAGTAMDCKCREAGGNHGGFEHGKIGI